MPLFFYRFPPLPTWKRHSQRESATLSRPPCWPALYDTSIKSGARPPRGRRAAAVSGTLSQMFGRRTREVSSSPRGDASACKNGIITTRHADAGFTLLEVLVALAIAVPALALLYRQGVASMAVTQTAAAYQEAISRAQSRLDALRDDSVVSGERNGDDGGGFSWRTRIAPIAATAPPRPVPRGSAYARGTSLFAVVVEISWPGGNGPRTLTLDTRRLGPAAAVGP